MKLSIVCGLLVLFCIFLPAQTPLVVLVDTPVLIPDESGTANTLLHIRNGGSPARIELSISDFEHVRPTTPPERYSLGTTALFAGFSAEDQKILDSGTLAPRQTLSVKLTVNHLWEAGASRARLYNDGLPITGADGAAATIKAVRVPAVYNIQLMAPGDPPQILFRGGKGRLQLKNLDAMNYDFRWSLRAEGQDRTGQVEIPANSVTTLDLSSAAPQSSWLGGVLKEQRESAEFVLEPAFPDVNQPAPAKAFPVRLRLRWAGPYQDAVNLACLIALLVVGGTVSIWVNFGLPNTTRVLTLRKRIWQAQNKLNGTGELLAERWRVILGAQVDWVLREMRSTLWIFPAFSTTLDAMEKKTELLEEWIDVAYDVSVITERLQQAQRKMRIPPTLLRFVEQHCERAMSPLETAHTNDEELHGMRQEVSAAKACLEETSGPNHMLEETIANREASLRGRIDELRQSPAAEFSHLLDDFEAAAEQPLNPAVYPDRDLVSIKLALLAEFWDCVRRMTPTVAVKVQAAGRSADVQMAQHDTEVGSLRRIEQAQPRFFDALRADTYHSLAHARLLLEEMHQDIYPDLLLNELSPEPRLRIVTEPRVLAPGAPVRCGLRFQREMFNDTAARQELTCLWTFGDGSQPRAGWTVFHTFPQHGVFPVEVKLLDPEARPVEHPALLAKVTVDCPKPRNGARLIPKARPETLLEGSRLALVLAAAVFGLIATAQDKTQDLTTLQAAAAVFALGFGADTLKNMVLRKA